MASCSADLRLQLTARLASGERLLWAGRPGPAAYAWHRRRLHGPVGTIVAALGAAALWQGGAVWGGLPGGALALFGGLFMVAGIGVATEPLRRWHAAGRVAYGVTSRRALLLEPGRQRSIAPPEFTAPHMVGHRDGTTSLLFFTEATSSYGWGGARGFGPASAGFSVRPEGFLGIDDPDGAIRALREIAPR